MLKALNQIREWMDMDGNFKQQKPKD